jgi:hypothetical protein
MLVAADMLVAEAREQGSRAWISRSPALSDHG